MDKEQIKELIEKEDLTLTDVIDTVVEMNGIIGVGLISLGSNLRDYCHNKTKRESTDIEKRSFDGSITMTISLSDLYGKMKEELESVGVEFPVKKYPNGDTYLDFESALDLYVKQKNS